MANFTYHDIERLKAKIEVDAGIFEAEHHGSIVKIAIEVIDATKKSEKVKVTLAGPYAPTLPGINEMPRQQVQEQLRQWWVENPGESEREQP